MSALTNPVTPQYIMIAVAILVPVGVSLWTLHTARKVNGKKDIEEKLEKKVSIVDCRSFKSRIGNEVSGQQAQLEKLFDQNRRHGEALGYIAGRMGKQFPDLGLNS